jgi:hypothetical protein
MWAEQHAYGRSNTQPKRQQIAADDAQGWDAQRCEAPPAGHVLQSIIGLANIIHQAAPSPWLRVRHDSPMKHPLAAVSDAWRASLPKGPQCAAAPYLLENCTSTCARRELRRQDNPTTTDDPSRLR